LKLFILLLQIFFSLRVRLYREIGVFILDLSEMCFDAL